MISKREILKLGAGVMASAGLPAFPRALAAPTAAIESGSFAPNWPSLAGGYKAPAWFHDAKRPPR